MSRLIDADALEREGWSLCRTFQKDKDTMVYEVKKPSDFPTIEPERTGKWIPCSERLPEEGKDVLAAVYFEGVKGFKPCHYVDIASRIDNEWSSDSDEHKIARDKHHIIAWMPLPEPYVEG